VKLKDVREGCCDSRFVEVGFVSLEPAERCERTFEVNMVGSRRQTSQRAVLMENGSEQGAEVSWARMLKPCWPDIVLLDVKADNSSQLCTSDKLKVRSNVDQGVNEGGGWGLLSSKQR